MQTRAFRRALRIVGSPVTKSSLRCQCVATTAVMPPKVLLAAKPETYDQQIGEKRKRIEDLFAKFKPPELEVFESEREHYRMRSVCYQA